jgi:hypothetical protein
MLALEVRLNGKRVCIAGAEDLGVLSAHVTATGKLGKKTLSVRPDDAPGDIFYSVGGLTRRNDPKKDVYVLWKSTAPLRVGDVVEVKILETEKVDRAKSRKSAAKKHSLPPRRVR